METEVNVMAAPVRILLIEDSPSDALLMQNRLSSVQEFEFEVAHVERLADGIARAESERFDAVLLDLNLPDSTGLETIRSLRKTFDALPIIVLTSMEDRDLIVESMSNGADSYLVKDKTDGNRMAVGILWAMRNRGS